MFLSFFLFSFLLSHVDSFSIVLELDRERAGRRFFHSIQRTYVHDAKHDTPEQPKTPVKAHLKILTQMRKQTQKSAESGKKKKVCELACGIVNESASHRKLGSGYF